MMVKPLLVRAVAVVAFFSAVAPAAAQQFPASGRSVAIVNPFPPGGLVDIVGRLMAAKMQESLGVPVIVENRPGANGAIGMAHLARSRPDGHTLAIVPTSTIAINPWLYKDLQYQPRDLTPVMNAISLPNALVVHPSVPAANLKELIDLMRREPGKLNFASQGQGSGAHLLAELFRSFARAEITHVPYKGSGPAFQDLVAGKVDLMFDSLPTVLPMIRAGKLRALAVTSIAPSPQAPEIPPIASLIPGFEAITWIGYFAPAGLPKDVLAKLNEHLARAVRHPEVSKTLQERGAVVISSTPEEFARTVAADLEKWGRVVSEAKVTIQ
jgi:tripartite-type tricarboxylate transporter receptor subunit TctC